MSISTALAGEVQVTHRLALAVQPVDAVTREVRTTHLHVGRETPQSLAAYRRTRPPVQDPTVPIPAHGAGFVLTHGRGVRSTEVLRITSRTRHFVPRRFSVLVWPEERLAADDADGTTAPHIGVPHRLLRPWLLPGSAYRPPSGATGALLRVARPDGTPVRWARAHAFDVHGTRVGWAHGDESGQLMLLVPRGEWPPPEPATLNLAVRFFAPAVPAAPIPAGADVVRLEPLSDLPVEVLPAPADPPGPPVLVSDLLRGITPPTAHVVAAQDEVIALQYGRVVAPPTVIFHPTP